jgi:hypothetical protein
VSGGNSFDSLFRSKVVLVDLAPDLLTTQTQLTDVRLLNMNLKAEVDGVVAMLPNATTSLSLGNTLLYEFPNQLAALPDLQTLYVLMACRKLHGVADSGCKQRPDVQLHQRDH